MPIYNEKTFDLRGYGSKDGLWHANIQEKKYWNKRSHKCTYNKIAHIYYIIITIVINSRKI